MKIRIGILLLVAMATGASAANIVNNGGFEVDAVGVNTFANTRAITGWTVISGRVQRIGVLYLGAPSREVNLAGSDNNPDTGLSQSLLTVAGTSYRVKFDVFTGFGFSRAGGVNASIGAVNLGTGLQGSLTGNGRKSYSFDYLATGSTTLIKFLHDSSGDAAHIDNVSVEATPVPEPATFVAVGVGVVGVLRRRRANQNA